MQYDRPEHVTGVEGRSQHNTPLVPENDGVAGTSSDKGKGKSETNKPPSSDPIDDEEARVNSDLLNAWTQRLQILTVVTTFLASMDGELFSLTALNTQLGLYLSRTAREVVYACLAGALIFHVCASILGYIASFALIRYRIVDAASEEEAKVGGALFLGLSAAQPGRRHSRKIVIEPVHPLQWLTNFLQPPERLRFPSISRRSSAPPLSLLTRCYYTTLCLAAIGFTLALTGILTYTWAGLQIPVGIFSTVSLGVCISAGVWAIAM